MPAPTDLTCAICGETAADATELAECLECRRWFHLNPYSNRPGKDCGDAVIGESDGIVMMCNECAEAEERRRIAALGVDRTQADALGGGPLGGQVPVPPSTSEAPPRTFRRVEDE